MENTAIYNSVAELECLDVNELLPEQVIKNIEAIATHQDRYHQNSEHSPITPVESENR